LVIAIYISLVQEYLCLHPQFEDLSISAIKPGVNKSWAPVCPSYWILFSGASYLYVLSMVLPSCYVSGS